MTKRERWTEADLDALPPGEHDYFDRKSGLLYDNNKGEFLDTIAKALSAFANSGGGHLVLGVSDIGVPDGMPPKVGGTPMREWLEQKVPDLLDYPLSDFRVHVVARSSVSRIPPDREVFVVDVGDSALAPHQSRRNRNYYYRSAGHSELAPHFYLELLRQRLTNPTLEFTLTGLTPVAAHALEGSIFLETNLDFIVENTGRIAAYKWALLVRSVDGIPAGREEDYRVGRWSFPSCSNRDLRRRIDDTVLPGVALRETIEVGCFLRPAPMRREALLQEVRMMIASVSLSCQLATETSPGDLTAVDLSSVTDVDEIVDYVVDKNRLLWVPNQ